MSHFKTQQEICTHEPISTQYDRWGIDIRGEPICVYCEVLLVATWNAVAQPAPKTKVWRWEKEYRCTTLGFKYIDDTTGLFCEGYAAKNLPGYTKVPNSEREI